MEAQSGSAGTPESELNAQLAARLFGPEHDSDIVSHCPEFMRPIASAIIREFGAAPEAVVAAMLAIAAAALGSKFRVETRGRELLPASFNLVIAHRSLRHLGWFGLIQGPFVARVTEMQIALHRDGISATKKAIQKRLEDYDAAARTKLPNQRLIDELKVDVARMQARLRPHVITDKLSIKMIAEHLTRAFDNSILAITACTDLRRTRGPVGIQSPVRDSNSRGNCSGRAPD